MELAFALLLLSCHYINGNVVERNWSDHTEVTKNNATATSAHFAAVTPLQRRMIGESAAFPRPTEHELQPVQKNVYEEHMDRARRDEPLLTSGLLWNDMDQDGSEDNGDVYEYLNDDSDGYARKENEKDDESGNFESQNERVRAYGFVNRNGDDDTNENEEADFYNRPLEERFDDFRNDFRKDHTIHLHFTALSPKSRAIFGRMLSLLSDEVGKSPRETSDSSDKAGYDIIENDPCTREHMMLAVEAEKWGCRDATEFYNGVCKKYDNCINRRAKRRCIAKLCDWAKKRKSSKPCYLKIFGCN